MRHAPTVRQVAAQAGVATGTVSRVLNGHGNVDGELAERVLRVARELGYNRPRSAQIRRPISDVGFLLTSKQQSEQRELLTPFWAEILQGAEAEARQRGAKVTYRTLTTPAGGVSLEQSVREMQLDAVLLVGSATADVINAVAALDIPTGLVDMVSPEVAVDAVLSDGLGGARRAVRHLIAHGHRDIAFIGGPFPLDGEPISPIHSIEQRRLGYQLALAEAGIPFRRELIAPSDMYPAGNQKAIQELLSRRTHFTAAFCTNDQIAVSVLRVLRDEGIAVPEDISVIGFDDDVAVHTVPALTTMRVHKDTMGEIAIRRLFDRIDRTDEPAYTITTPVELMERGTVAAPAKRPWWER